MNRQVNIGEWLIDWDAGWIRSRKSFWAKRQYLDPRSMAVLKFLAVRVGEIVTVERILEGVWHDRVVSRDSVSTAIYQLRQALGDQSQGSTYIKTEARQGYRLIADVSSNEKKGRRVAVVFPWAAAACLVLLATVWTFSHPAKNNSALILVEEMLDQTTDDSLRPLHEAIGSSLFGELVDQMPGRVVLASSPVTPAYTLQSQIVACDLGPTLLVRLMNTDESRYLWSQAYRLEDWAGGPGRPTLVQTVADEIGIAVDTL